MNALAVEGVQVGGERRDKGFAFARLHFEMRPEWSTARQSTGRRSAACSHAEAGLADNGKGFRQQVVQRLPVSEASLEFDGFCAELLVGQRLNSRLEYTDLTHDRTQFLQIAFVLGANYLCEDVLIIYPVRPR